MYYFVWIPKELRHFNIESHSLSALIALFCQPLFSSIIDSIWCKLNFTSIVDWPTNNRLAYIAETLESDTMLQLKTKKLLSFLHLIKT